MDNRHNGFVSSIWGPALWFSIHCMSMNYPSSPTSAEKQHYRKWFEGLEYVLPCGICRSNFRQNLKDIGYDADLHLESRLMFSYIVFKLHNNVRKMQGKSTDMTFNDCILFYEQFRAQDCIPNTSDGEGGCFAKKPLTCRLFITNDRAERAKGTEGTECRITIDPSCDIKIE